MVLAGVHTTAKDGFLAEVVDSKLRLTSGSQLPLSSVTVTEVAAETTAATLKLNAAQATSKTGDQSFFDTFVPTSPATLAGGNNGTASQTKADYVAAFEKLRKFRDVNIVMTPDHSWSAGASQTIVEAAITHAESTQTCMVIVDPPPSVLLDSEATIASLGLPSSTYTALYYPWVHAVNPHYHPELRPQLPSTFWCRRQALPPACGPAPTRAAVCGRHRQAWQPASQA